MQRWIVEADVYRLTKAFDEATADQRAELTPHLRRAEAQLSVLRRRGVAG